MWLTWTEPALRDLAAARGYIAQENPASAKPQVSKIVERIEMLRRLPESGRPGRRPGTRELVVSGTPFVVPYRIRGENIEILRVLHHRRRWPEAFD
jgi:toxin ParE1/3/4